MSTRKKFPKKNWRIFPKNLVFITQNIEIDTTSNYIAINEWRLTIDEFKNKF